MFYNTFVPINICIVSFSWSTSRCLWRVKTDVFLDPDVFEVSCHGSIESNVSGRFLQVRNKL